MADQAIEIINNFDVLFAIRTGVTILVPQSAVFDCGVEIPVHFKLSPDNPRDLLIEAAGRTAVLKDMAKANIDQAVARGSIMFYEMKDDEVVRCTPCSLAR